MHILLNGVWLASGGWRPVIRWYRHKLISPHGGGVGSRKWFFKGFKKMHLCTTSDHFWAWAGVGLPGVIVEKVRKGALLDYNVHYK